MSENILKNNHNHTSKYTIKIPNSIPFNLTITKITNRKKQKKNPWKQIN